MNRFRSTRARLLPYLRTAPLALVLCLVPFATLAQEGLTLTELESLYRAASGEHESANERLEVLYGRHRRATQDFDLARAAGDENRINAAFTQIQILSDEIGSQERRVEELRNILTVARRRYIEGLESRLDSLLAERVRARAPQDSVSLAIDYTDTNNRYQDLLQEEDDPTLTTERASSPIRDPRDTPEDLRRKAAQEEWIAEKFASLIQEFDLRLAELREASRRDRIARDFMTGLDRFGDTRPPGVPPGARTTASRDPAQLPAGADSAGVGRPLTLEERIQSLDAQRALTEELIRQARANAQQYRRWAGGDG